VSAHKSAGPSYVAILLPPVVLILLGVVPGVNLFLYTGHGGLGWILVYLCLPYVVFGLALRIKRCEPAHRSRRVLSASIALVMYIVLAFPLTYLAAHRIKAAIGLDPWRDYEMYRGAIFPLGLAFRPSPPDDPAVNR
jgi:hypothetical protein